MGLKHIYIFLCLFAISGVVSADNVIVGAFGQKLGATIDENIHKFDLAAAVKDSRRVPIYKFFPEKIIRPFQFYRVAATPATKRIFKIWAIGGFGERGQCGPYKEALKIVLKKQISLTPNYRRQFTPAV